MFGAATTTVTTSPDTMKKNLAELLASPARDEGARSRQRTWPQNTEYVKKA